MVTFVTLVLPNVDYKSRHPSCQRNLIKKLDGVWEIFTKGIIVAHLSAPAANQIDLVLWGGGHARVPAANQLDIFVHLVGMDFVENDGMDVFAASEDLGIGTFDVFVELLTFFGSIDE